MPGSQSCCSALVLRLSVPRTVFCFHDVSTRVSRYAISWMSLRRFWIRMRFLTLAADGCRGRSDKQHPRAPCMSFYAPSLHGLDRGRAEGGQETGNHCGKQEHERHEAKHGEADFAYSI